MGFRDGIQTAFRFVKKEILREENDLPQPIWVGFDQDDMFTSIIPGSVVRTGYTDDGDSEVSRVVAFLLGSDIVATVTLNGLQTPWGSSWTVNRVIYRSYWHPLTGASNDLIDVDVAATYADNALTAAI